MARDHDSSERQPGEPDESADDHPLPPAVVEEAERLTRRAREAVDDNEADAYRRERTELIAEYSYRARVREDDEAVLVLYPDEWLEDGIVQREEIDDLDRGIERPLEGSGDDNWETVEQHNRALADEVETSHGAVHGANAHALADFMGNHYAKQVEQATGEDYRLDGLAIDIGAEWYTNSTEADTDLDGDGTVETIRAEFDGMVGQNVTVTVETDGTEGDVLAVNGEQYREQGPPPWAGGPHGNGPPDHAGP